MTNNFIGIYENIMSDELCNKFIEFFEQCDSLSFVKTRQELEQISRLKKQDDSFSLTEEIAALDEKNLFVEFENLFWGQVYASYAEEFAILSELQYHKIYSMKLQRTPVGGGYHIWHCEQAAKENAACFLTFICYLNDVSEGGETEFLYYPKRIPAKKGTFCIFPGGFTHTHRGNQPLTNAKYVITGWVEFCGIGRGN